MKRIDFNCDLGEGCGQDDAILPFISSASIACGGHAGDADTMRAAIEGCLRHEVAVGAHPSFEDREHFGRRELAISTTDVQALVARQVGKFMNACAQLGVHAHHVKPHGALYNLAARDAGIADAIAAAVHAIDPSLWLYALSGSQLACASEAHGLRVAHEVFAERRYETDGTLTPRGTEGAVIADIATSLAQVREMLDHGVVTARTGERIAIRADTLCLHGDRVDAPAFAQVLHDALRDAGIRIAALGAT